jgi:hypothetical protein
MSAIVLDFNKELLFLDGKPIMDQKLKADDPDIPVMINKMLATNLSQSPKGGMKMFHWALDLYKEGTLTLDKVDRDLLKTEIDTMQISNLVKGRAITVIEEAEKAADKEEDKARNFPKKTDKALTNNQ